MTIREQLQMQYWQVAEKTLVSLADNIVTDYVFGKKIHDDRKLTLLHNLQFYLDILQQQIEADIGNGSFSGISYYKTLFCIDKIQKQLRCTGIDNNILAELFSIYLQDISVGQGIGSMIIQGAVNPFHIRPAGQPSTGYNPILVPVHTPGPWPPIYVCPLPPCGYDIMVVRTNVKQDTTFPNLLPANCQFVNLTFKNLTVNVAQLSMGITVGGVECFGSWGLSPSGLTTAIVNKSFSSTLPTTLYLNHASAGDDWGGAIFDLTFWFKKL